MSKALALMDKIGPIEESWQPSSRVVRAGRFDDSADSIVTAISRLMDSRPRVSNVSGEITVLGEINGEPMRVIVRSGRR